MTDQSRQIKDYRGIFLSEAPLLDLRSPGEFAQGAFSQAVNLPLMDNEQRAQVGTCYKRHGKEAAITLGHQLVSGSLKQQRLTSWLDFARKNPTGYLYCFRGGLRSQTVQTWMREASVDYPLVKGGYKALRRFLMAETLRIAETMPMFLLSGFTGVGKTRLLGQFNQTLDLEGLANHRGSSFGRQLSEQPSQIDFENQLAQQLMHIEAQQSPFMLLEDESRLIGSRSVPLELHLKMKQAPIILLQESFSARLENIYQEYVVERYADYCAAAHPNPLGELSDYLQTAVAGISKRLGNERYQEMRELINVAIAEQEKTNDSRLHYAWIRLLLTSYYDPMYEYQLSKKQQRVIFQGNEREVCQYIQQLADRID